MTQRAFDQDAFPYFVTFVVEGRNWVFTDVDVAGRLHQTIKNACVLKDFTLFAFCILPDHAHILVKKNSQDDLFLTSRGLENPRAEIRKPKNYPKSESGFSNPRTVNQQHVLSNPRTVKKDHSLSDLVKSMKGTFSWSKPYHGRFWQPRLYYRIVPSERYLRNVLVYIKNNYRKQGLLKFRIRSRPTFLWTKKLSKIFLERALDVLSQFPYTVPISTLTLRVLIINNLSTFNKG